MIELPNEGSTGSSSITWNGSPDEALALLQAIQAHCECPRNSEGIQTSACESHKMLARDQRAIDGLLFMRRMVKRLLTEEFMPPDVAELREEVLDQPQSEIRIDISQNPPKAA